MISHWTVEINGNTNMMKTDKSHRKLRLSHFFRLGYHRFHFANISIFCFFFLFEKRSWFALSTAQQQMDKYAPLILYQFFVWSNTNNEINPYSYHSLFVLQHFFLAYEKQYKSHFQINFQLQLNMVFIMKSFFLSFFHFLPPAHSILLILVYATVLLSTK